MAGASNIQIKETAANKILRYHLNYIGWPVPQVFHPVFCYSVLLRYIFIAKMMWDLGSIKAIILSVP